MMFRRLLEWSCLLWRVPDDLVELRRKSAAAQRGLHDASAKVAYAAQNGFGDVVARGAGLKPHPGGRAVGSTTSAALRKNAN